jgi:hypothetical protein
LAVKDIGFIALLRPAGVATEVGVVLPLQRIVLPDGGAGDQLLGGLFVVAGRVQQKDCDHDDHNDCQGGEERRRRRPV